MACYFTLFSKHQFDVSSGSRLLTEFTNKITTGYLTYFLPMPKNLTEKTIAWKNFSLKKNSLYCVQSTKNVLQAVCPPFGMVVTPSHGSSASQFCASPVSVLIVFPEHRAQESPLW